MRGPNYRVVGDVRRTWRCPKCGVQRKFSGEVTALRCGCQAGEWMQIVVERTNAPRPFQEVSDVERHPIDFGIEPKPPAPKKPEATIIKSAISADIEVSMDLITQTEIPSNESKEVAQPETTVEETTVKETFTENTITKEMIVEQEDDWGEGIL